MKKILKNDEVIVISGKDKGKTGLVSRVISANYLAVSGINISKKSVKQNMAKEITSGFANVSMPIHVSNIALYNPATETSDKVSYKTIDGEKTRVFKSDNEIIKAR